MHDTAFQIGTLAINIYADLKSAAILEIGSRAVNGSLRENALPTTKYIGIDLEEGDGVDVVVEPGKPLPVDDGAFDLVIASSVFEHDPCFWITFLEMCRKTKDGGYIYVNAPSNGFVHRFPQDNWRFYPDSGKALVHWAVSQGQPVSLVESFIADRADDVWNDFVAVFRKGRITKKLPDVFIHEHVPCSNVVTWKSKVVINPRDASQDMLMLNDANGRAQQAEAALTEATKQLDSSAEETARLAAQVTELEKIHGELALRESELRQRQEEIGQTRSELLLRQSERDEARAQLAAAERELKALEEEMARHLEASSTEIERLKDDLTKNLREAENGRTNAETAARANAAKLADRYQELAAVTKLLRQQEQRSEENLAHLKWLIALNERMATQPRWWNLMPKSWRRQRSHQRLQRIGLFDGGGYLERYSDVADAGLDPLDHYLRHGLHEGRSRTL